MPITGDTGFASSTASLSVKQLVPFQGPLPPSPHLECQRVY